MQRTPPANVQATSINSFDRKLLRKPKPYKSMYLNSCTKVPCRKGLNTSQIVKVMDSGLPRINPSIKKQIIMRINITALLIAIACIQVSAKVFAQINLSEKNAPLTQVLTAMQQQSGYTFFYKHQLVEDIKVSLELHNATLPQAMEKLFQNLPLVYTFVDNTVVIKKKKTQQPSPSQKKPQHLPGK